MRQQSFAIKFFKKSIGGTKLYFCKKKKENLKILKISKMHII